MKILKKNQIVIIVIAVMLITAGYLNYKTGDEKDLLTTSNLMDSEEVAEIGDAKLVNSNKITEKNTSLEIEENDENKANKQKNGIVENEDENKEAINSNQKFRKF